MILATAELASYAGKVAMVDGGFDPLHGGHIDYFAAAAELGLPVLCNVAADRYVRAKHPPLLDEHERLRVLDALRDLAFVHLSTSTTADVLRTLRPRYYAKGIDWQGRLPPEELAACAELGIEIVYLDTVTGSSSDILRRYRDALGSAP